MGNKFACKVNGIGTVKLLLENGNVLFLNETRYAPDLKMKLVSLGMLNEMEFNINLG